MAKGRDNMFEINPIDKAQIGPKVLSPIIIAHPPVPPAIAMLVLDYMAIVAQVRFLIIFSLNHCRIIGNGIHALN